MIEQYKNRMLAAALVSLFLLSACSGSGSSSLVREDESDSGGPSGSGIEQTAQSGAESGDGVGETVAMLGGEISQTEMPVGGEVTSGTGEVLIALGGGIQTFSSGVDDGLGHYRSEENFLGTTAASGGGLAAGGGEAVVALGAMIESLNSLPVLMQMDEKSGAVSTLGGIVSELGIKLTAFGDRLSAEFTGGEVLGAGTSELSAVVRPVLIKTEDGLGQAGDALLIGPVASELLDEAAAVVVASAQEFGALDPRLAGAESIMTGGGHLLSSTGQLLTASDEGDAPIDIGELEDRFRESFPDGLDGGDPVNELVAKLGTFDERFGKDGLDLSPAALEDLSRSAGVLTGLADESPLSMGGTDLMVGEVGRLLAVAPGLADGLGGVVPESDLGSADSLTDGLGRIENDLDGGEDQSEALDGLKEALGGALGTLTNQ